MRNLMTEDAAKKKWCPLANAHGDSALRHVSPSRLDGVWQHTLCIGAQCMAWRVARPDLQKPDMGEIGAGALGYCGAFGAAE